MKTSEINKILASALGIDEATEILEQLEKIKEKDEKSPRGILYANLEKLAKEIPNVEVTPSFHDYNVSVDVNGCIGVNDNWIAPLYPVTQPIVF